MRANEFLTELANFSYEILLRDVKGNGEIRYYFETETGHEYVVNIEAPFDPTDRAVGFQMRSGGGWTEKATGSAGARSFKVFSTVIQCVKDALATFPEVDNLYFAARFGEDSRAALYHRFATNVGQYLPGWKKVKPKWIEDTPSVRVYAVSRAP